MRKEENHKLISNYSFEEKLRNRNNWVKIVFSGVILLFLMIKFYKFNINTNFDYSEFLSLILSLFALGISIAFYFKASDTSNKFYDSTYKFTKDISESIGRMDERFGEKLNNLDQEYERLINNAFPYNKQEINKQRQIEIDQSKYKEIIKQKEKIIEDLINKSKLSQKEKEDYQHELDIKNEELLKLNKHINDLLKKNNFSSKQLELIKEMMTKNSNKMIELYKYFYEKKSIDNRDRILISNAVMPRANTNLYRSMKKYKLILEDEMLSKEVIIYVIDEIHKIRYDKYYKY